MNSKIDHFFELVSDYYNVFKNGGFIDTASLNRVLSVLATHCVGDAAGCTSLHKLPDSRLPSASTHKIGNFWEAEAPTTVTRTGSFSIVGAPNTASGNSFVRMNNGAEITFTGVFGGISTPSSMIGKAVVRKVSSSPQLEIRIDGTLVSTHSVGGSVWHWITSGSKSVYFGSHTVKIKVVSGGPLDIDVGTILPAGS